MYIYLPILGVALIVCPKSHVPIHAYFISLLLQNESIIFPPMTGGAEKMCAEMGLPFLGKLPLDPRIGQYLLVTRKKNSDSIFFYLQVSNIPSVTFMSESVSSIEDILCQILYTENSPKHVKQFKKI